MKCHICNNWTPEAGCGHYLPTVTSEKKSLYYLVDPLDDTGNDDGILDSKQLTKQEANDLNNMRRLSKSDRRWILANPGNASLFTKLSKRRANLWS